MSASHLFENELTDFGCLHVLQVHSDLAGYAISKAKIGRSNLHWRFITNPTCKEILRYLKCIFLVHPFNWRCESSELIGEYMDVVNCMGSMARAARMLGGVDEPEDGGARRGHSGRKLRCSADGITLI